MQVKLTTAKTLLTALLLVSTCVSLNCRVASGQDFLDQGFESGSAMKPQFPPPRPTLSPYLDLLRNDSGVVSPYHAFVLPRRQIAQQQTRQSAQINRLQTNVQNLGVSFERAQVSRLRIPTGHGGYFQQYSHFFPVPNATRR